MKRVYKPGKPGESEPKKAKKRSDVEWNMQKQAKGAKKTMNKAKCGGSTNEDAKACLVSRGVQTSSFLGEPLPLSRKQKS